MRVIYAPTARAAEYAMLAVNIGVGCSGACRYCYAKHMAHKSAEQFHKVPMPCKNLLTRLERDCQEMDANQDKRGVFLCFMCDPFEPSLVETTMAAIRILRRHDIPVRTLTKRPMRAPMQLLADLGVDFGITLSGASESMRQYWEPGTDCITARLDYLEYAKQLGMKTWVSMEPVIDDMGCLGILLNWQHEVDFWRVGKMNGRDAESRALESSIDWAVFVREVRRICPPAKLYVKEDLAKWETP